MNNGSIATRYARALFEEARDNGVDDKVYIHLSMLQKSMTAEPELQSVLISPRITPEKKLQLLATASGDDVDGSLYDRFLKLVIKHGRESYMRTIIFVYSDIYREEHGIDRVVFETAKEMDAEVLERVTQKVSAKTGHKVELVTSIRPELIGGFRIRIGDIRYDYSYQTKLLNIRKRLWNK
ncbi:MAG: F0F1 ATP synthase subunit delta [Bacteroidaceae bacterium]|nr:F0F1 ATP synthase subunit delta [Bacteroidaceae bacterium]